MTRRSCISTSTLADYLGERAAASVATHYGGVTIKTPKTASGSVFADLCAKLGEPLALAFVETFQGEHLYIALDERALQDARIADLLAMRDAGMSFAEIARVYRAPPKRFSERWIRQLLARSSGEGLPPTLPADRPQTADLWQSAEPASSSPHDPSPDR